MGAVDQKIHELGERAFEPAPDPRFYFPSLTQRKAMSAVSYALNRGAGLVTVTGPEGLGKSLLLAHLADQIAGQPVTLAWVVGGPEPLATRVAEALGLAPPEKDSHALAAIDAFLLEEMRRGQRALLLLDRAEALADDAAADLAALAGLHHGERSLVQIVLAGDDSFAQRLADSAEWSAVRGRTVASHSFEPLLRDEVEPYLRHRLMCAGWQGDPALDPGLASLLHEATGGVPAAINRAMSVLMDEAAATGAGLIEGDALAAWLDGEANEAEYEIVEAETDEAAEPHPSAALGEAQIEAIEHAFAERDRQLARLRRELAELRERSEPASSAPASPEAEDRLAAIEARLDQHEEALRQMLERLIVYFERGGAVDV